MSKSCAADLKQRGVRVGSLNSRDQGIFIRGYKLCDRHTGLSRVHHRKCSKYDKDGFIPIPPRDEEIIGGISRGEDSSKGDDDEDKEGDSSGSRQVRPSGRPSNSSSPSSNGNGNGGATSSTSGRSDRNSSPSDSEKMDSLELSIDADEDLALYLQLVCNKVCTLVTTW